jgi:predicted DNA-binding transcriptional regulator YafY
LHRQLDAEGYVVGKRTVERDLQVLSGIFPLVVDERSKPFGWSWDKDAPTFDLPGMSASEALTLLMARDHLRTVLPAITVQQLEGHFRQAELRISTSAEQSALASWRNKVRIVQPVQPLLAPTVDAEVLGTVQQALLRNLQVQLTYQRRGAETGETYVVNPLGLVQRGQLLYLVATIKTYSDVRLLVLHRAQAAESLLTPVIRPPDFDLDDYLAAGALSWKQGGGSISLVLNFTHAAGVHLYETPLAADQTIQVQADGSLQVVATVQQSAQLIWWLLGFGDAVEVLAPPQLRDTMRTQANGMAARYARSELVQVEPAGQSTA